MKTFSQPLDTRYDPGASEALGTDHWRVINTFSFIGTLPRLGLVWITVPAGYLTDGASVPRLVWSLVPPWGPYGQAAAAHDLLCEYLSVMTKAGAAAITRAEADDLFRQAMAALNVPLVTRTLMYASVSTYRVLTNTHQPSNTPLKRRLESVWPQ